MGNTPCREFRVKREKPFLKTPNSILNPQYSLLKNVMTWQKKKNVWLICGVLLLFLCSFGLNWLSEAYSKDLKDKLKEAEKSYSAKDYSKAEDVLIQLSLSFPHDSRFSYFQLMIAKCEYNLNKYDSAQEKLKEFIQKFPQSSYVPSGWFMLGNIAYLTGNTSESAQNYVQSFHLAKTEPLRILSQRSLEPLLRKWLSEEELNKLSQKEKNSELAPKSFFG